MKKLLIYGGAFLSFLLALVGKLWGDKRHLKKRQKAKEKAVKEYQEGERIYNEGIEKDNIDIRNDTYYK